MGWELNVQHPQGAFLCFSPCGKTLKNLLQKVIEKGVVMVNGAAFGESGSNHVRLSYATSYNM